MVPVAGRHGLVQDRGHAGVLALRAEPLVVVADLLDKIGVTTDSAQRGANSAMFSATSDFSHLARARLQAFLDKRTPNFEGKVSEDMPPFYTDWTRMP